MVQPLTLEEYIKLANEILSITPSNTKAQYEAWTVDTDVHQEYIIAHSIEGIREIFSGKKTVFDVLSLNAFIFFELGYAYRLEIEKRTLQEELNAA